MYVAANYRLGKLRGQENHDDRRNHSTFMGPGAGKLRMCCIVRELFCFLPTFLWRGAAVPRRSDDADVYLNTMHFFRRTCLWPFPNKHQEIFPDRARIIFQTFNILTTDRFHARRGSESHAPLSLTLFR